MVLTENNICFLTFPFFLASSFAVLNLAVQFCCVSLTLWGHQWLFQGLCGSISVTQLQHGDSQLHPVPGTSLFQQKAEAAQCGLCSHVDGCS